MGHELQLHPHRRLLAYVGRQRILMEGCPEPSPLERRHLKGQFLCQSMALYTKLEPLIRVRNERPRLCHRMIALRDLPRALGALLNVLLHAARELLQTRGALPNFLRFPQPLRFRHLPIQLLLALRDLLRTLSALLRRVACRAANCLQDLLQVLRILFASEGASQSVHALHCIHLRLLLRRAAGCLQNLLQVLRVLFMGEGASQGVHALHRLNLSRHPHLQRLLWLP
mmetsp:Transcript_53514/g.162523  ORF Transcript_53514/g.162523 Transcript_53514/m.162523 type:complete len:227 (+) Transcript_53514:260-940(+)